MSIYRYQKYPVFWQFYLLFIECIIECKSVIFDVLGDSIDPILRLMDFDLRIGTGNGIDLSVCLLLFENWSLPDTDS